MLSSSISRPHRIAEAIRRRASLAARADLTAYRLLHGEADGVPGLAVDRYSNIAVLHADSHAAVGRWLEPLREQLPAVGSAYLKIHPRAAGAAQRQLGPSAPVWGSPVQAVEVIENDIRYLVRPGTGLSVGLFLDMREVRAWLRRVAPGMTVLNLFAYTCSFGVSAALGGAGRVLNLDLSKPALESGKTNYRLNGLAVDDHDFVYGDAFDWLGRLARRGAQFDVVIVDPPSFSSTPFSITRDYSHLVSLAARIVAPAGMLVAATNHAGTSDGRFDAWLRAGLVKADRQALPLRRWHEPSVDFPLAPGSQPYLKVRALSLD